MRKTIQKKIIEVALPLAEINGGSMAETENPFLKGHPRAIHNWWARTPLIVCRAILFAQLIDDPGEGLDADQAEKAREPLLDLVRRLSTWDATTDAPVVDEARQWICRQFDGNPPRFWDFFAGRGSISIEAQRLGLRVYSSDLESGCCHHPESATSISPTVRRNASHQFTLSMQELDGRELERKGGGRINGGHLSLWGTD